MTKKCPKCNETKEYSMFYKSRYSKSGIQTYCIPCSKIIDKHKRAKLVKNGPTIIRENKVCAMCHNLKPKSQFPKSRNTYDGLVCYCKPCWVIYVGKAQAKRKRKNGTIN